MKKLYQRTFEQVLAQTCPPLNRVEEQRRALTALREAVRDETKAKIDANGGMPLSAE